MNKLNTQGTVVERQNQAQSRKEEAAAMLSITKEINVIENRKKLRDALKTSTNCPNFSQSKDKRKKTQE